MSTRRSDLRHHSSKQHIVETGANDIVFISSGSTEKKEKNRGIFSRMFGSSSNNSESNAEANYRKKMTEATEEQQQQHPYFHSSTNSSSASRERTRDRDREKERDRDREKEKDREREREREKEREYRAEKEYRIEREREKEREKERDIRDREREKDKDRDSGRPPKEKDSSRRDRDRDKDKDRGDASAERISSREGGRERERERAKDRDRPTSSREQHSQSFSHSSGFSSTADGRRYHTSSSNVLSDTPKKSSSSRTHSSSSSNLLSTTSSDEIKAKAGPGGSGSHENAYLSSLLSSSSPTNSSTNNSSTHNSNNIHKTHRSENNSSTSTTAVTKSSSGGGVSAGGSSSRHNSTDYDFGSSNMTSSPMMNMTPGSGITPSHQTLFMEMNRMFDVTGIKFDRSGVTAGEAIAILGDQHLAKLEDMCKRILACILSDRERATTGQSKDPDSLSNGQGHTEVALIYTEVLQLQGRPQEAVIVLSKAIEKLNSDLAEAKRQRKKDLHSSGDSSIVSGSTRTPTHTLEFDHLKKMKALCHRRIGSLYKLTHRLKDAEEHIKRYISIVERGVSTDAVKRETSLAYALLTSIYDAMGKTAEAQAADKEAIELAASMGRVE